MPTSPQRLCRNCSNRAIANGYCQQHQVTNRTTEYRKLYDKNRQSTAHRLLYKTAKWLRTRLIVLGRFPLCQSCGHRASTVVHHDVDAAEWIARGESFYDMANLLAWCKPCHDAHTSTTTGFAQRKYQV